MAVEILWDPRHQVAAMWDHTTDVAFGPVFSGPSADTEVQEFLDWLENGAGETQHDPRAYSPAALERLVRRWCDLPTLKEQ